MHPSFPATIDLKVLFLILFGMLLGLHVLVRWKRMRNPVWWRYVDYLWLTAAIVGIVGLAGSTRRATAERQLVMYQDLAQEAFSRVLARADRLCEKPGVICRTFVSSEHSPPEIMAATQLNYDRACEWINSVRTMIPSTQPSVPIDPSAWPKRTFGDVRDIEESVSWLISDIEYFNTRIREVNELHRLSKPVAWEALLGMFAPVLLVGALALRITKVSVEIMNARVTTRDAGAGG